MEKSVDCLSGSELWFAPIDRTVMSNGMGKVERDEIRENGWAPVVALGL